MSDYSELVKALRRCAEPGTIIDECDTTDDCPYSFDGYCGDCMNNLVKDAAAAIEALQAELGKEGKRVEHLLAMVNELEDKMPELGEWELIDGADPMRWGCSRCKYMSWETSTYCPRCGAKMEVQDG